MKKQTLLLALVYISMKPQIVLLVLSKVLRDFMEACYIHGKTHNTYAKRYG